MIPETMQSMIHRICLFHRRIQFIERCSRFSMVQGAPQRCFQSGWTSPHIGSVSLLNMCNNSLGPTRARFRRGLSTSSLLQRPESITINYVNRDGSKMSVKGVVGDSLLDVAIDNDLEIEGYGACEGTLACSTCHLIFEEDQFNSLPEPSDEEQDMLDFACGLTDTSRLGCQITVSKDMDGMTVRVPEGVADARDV